MLKLPAGNWIFDSYLTLLFLLSFTKDSVVGLSIRWIKGACQLVRIKPWSTQLQTISLELLHGIALKPLTMCVRTCRYCTLFAVIRTAPTIMVVDWYVLTCWLTRTLYVSMTTTQQP